MATINEIFTKTINESLKAAGKIADNGQQAMAYAEIAKALAATGLVKDTMGESTDITAAVTPQAEGKEALKANHSSKKTETKAEKAPAKAAETKVEEPAKAEETQGAAEEQFTAEWTEEAVAAKEEQLAFVQNLQEEYEEDAVNAAIEEFGEGNLHTVDDITPLNIDAFVTFVKMMQAEAEKQSA